MEQAPACFKCGASIQPHALYCPKCNRRLPLPLEGLERAYDDDMAQFIRVLESELKEDPKNYYRHFLLGNALFLTGDYRGAVHRYKMSLDLKPDFGDAKLNLGYVYKLLGEKKEAIGSLEAFRREQPHSNKVESVQKLICELKGIPYESKKGAPSSIPEIIKPRRKSGPAIIGRERLNIPAFVFICIILILLIFGLARKDVVIAAYAKSADVVGRFLSSDVNSDEVASEEESGGQASGESNPNGTDLMAGLFGRDERDVLESDDWKVDPTETPVVPAKPKEEEKEDKNAADPINLEPAYESYWPMKVGFSWKYGGYELDSLARHVEGSNQEGAIRIESLARSGETPVYEVSHLGSTSYFYENAQGVFKTAYPSRPFSTGVPNLVKPVTVGEKFSDPGIGMGYEVMEEIDIKVPAGLFRTVRVKTWITDFPDQITEVFYGKGIGPVKIVTGSKKQGFRIWELTSYRAD